MKEIPFKKLKRAPKNKMGSNNFGGRKKLLVKGKKAWKEQEEKPTKEFKIHVPLNKPAAELLSVRKNTIQTYMTAMSYLAKRITVDPTLTDYQDTLLEFLVEKCPLVAMTVRKYSAILMMEIFHDILPEHKVIEIKKGGELKEEVRETYKREDCILRFYMKYLKRVLQNLQEAERNKKDLGYQSLETTLVSCLGNLFMKHPKFNYHKDLLEKVTPYISSPQKETRQKVFNIFVQLLTEDQTGDMSLMIVKNIYRVIMKKKMQIHQDVVKVLYHLRLEHLYNIDKIRFEKKKGNTDMSHRQLLLKKMERKKGHDNYSRKERQEHKKDLHKWENKWLGEKEKLVEQQEKNNTEVLQLTLGVYFLILKKKPKPLVISAVFEGLARYAHLINIEFFCDLLKVMDEFFSSYRLQTTDQLYCIQTVFSILQAQSESLAIDPYRFYIHLYNVLGNIPTECSLENLQLLIGIFNLLFLGKKASVISVPRILALMKRFSSISCTMPDHTSTLMILATVSRHFSLNSFNEILLDTDQQGWPGRFTISNKEPDTANAGATALWELYLTQRHYHSHVKKLSVAMIKGDIYKHENALIRRLMSRSSKDLYQAYNLHKGVLNPGVPSPEDVIKTGSKSKATDDLCFRNLELYELCTDTINEDKSGPPSRKKRKTETAAVADEAMSAESTDLADFSYYLLGGEDPKDATDTALGTSSNAISPTR